MADNFIENGEELMGQLEIALETLEKSTQLCDENDNTRNSLKKVKEIIVTNQNILNDLKQQFKQIATQNIELECDKEQLQLELSTAQEQLSLHVRHSGNDQNIMIKMMSEIEELKEQNLDLSSRLTQEIENNQRRLHLLNKQTQGNLNKHDIQHFMSKIEKYHCKLLSLEAVLENLRRHGVKIPLFPTIQRISTGTQVDDNLVDTPDDEKQEKQSLYDDRIDHDHLSNKKKDQKINELLKEVKYLKSENDTKADKFRYINGITKQLKKNLNAQECKYNKLKLKNANLKESIKDKDELLSTFGRSRVVKLALLIAFVAGITYRKPKPLIVKRFL